MKILLFIGLKIVEVGGVIFVPYWVGSLIEKLTPTVENPHCALLWSTGLLFIFLVFVLAWLLKVIIPEWFELNWKLTKKIIRKIKK